jgi:site-specific DNA-methyltransferase (adenine-specific)/adenine-specific DNA-methyltransferase
MEKVTDEQIKFIVERLKEGKPLPEEFKWLLFEGKQETELIYAGKERDIDIITDTTAVPLQRVKAFGQIKEDEWHNMIIFGDNLQVLKELLLWKEAGKLKNPDGSLGIKLIYIDPPFGTGEIYGTGDVGAYSAKLVGAKFLEWLRKRLILLREILSDDGSIYVRMDYHFEHYVKVLLDEIFGKENFQNEIIVKRGKVQFGISNKYNVATDSIFFYTKTENYFFKKFTRERYEHEPKMTNMLLKGERHPRERIFYDENGNPHILIPPKNTHWKFIQEKLDEMHEKGLIILKKSSKGIESGVLEKTKRGLIKSDLMPYYYFDLPKSVDSNWTDISGYSQKWNYPTENSEQLLERIILSSSNSGDIVLDAFAGSGTTGAVAEKLGRRWIMIDASRLAIYTMVRRMLNLKEGIGNTGKPLKPKPFAVYNAGLYDYKMVKELPWEHYRKFALELFNCKDEPHEVGKLMLDGYFGLDHVLVFKWKNKEEYVVDYEYIDELHSLIGDKIGKRFFIIAPWANVVFREDVVPKDDVRYFILRIPYSVIDELHKKQFTPLSQPLPTREEVNAVLEQVGFDFINPPTVECEYYIDESKTGLGKFMGEKEAVIKIKKFYSNVVSKKPIPAEDRGFKSLSMIMIDTDYNGEWFNLSKWITSKDLEKNNWEIRLDTKKLGKQIMVVYIDIYGHEKKEVLRLEDFKKKNKSKMRK